MKNIKRKLIPWMVMSTLMVSGVTDIVEAKSNAGEYESNFQYYRSAQDWINTGIYARWAGDAYFDQGDVYKSLNYYQESYNAWNKAGFPAWANQYYSGLNDKIGDLNDEISRQNVLQQINVNKQQLVNYTNKWNWTNMAIYARKVAEGYESIEYYNEAKQYYNETAYYWTQEGHPTWGYNSLFKRDEMQEGVNMLTNKWLYEYYKNEKNAINMGIYATWIADYYHEIGKYNSAVKYDELANESWKTAGNPVWAKGYYERNQVRKEMFGLDIGANKWLVSFYEGANNAYNVAWYSHQLGDYYKHIKDYDSAKFYYLKAKENWKKAGQLIKSDQADTGYNLSDLEKQVRPIRDEFKMAKITNNNVNAAIHSSKIAKIYDSYGLYDDAVNYYLESARLWKNTNQSMNAVQWELRADELKTEVSMYVDTMVPQTGARGKYEPTQGVYLGMYPGENSLEYNLANIENLYGKKHSMYLTYVQFDSSAGYYSKFPTNFANQVKTLGGSIQIGWEPDAPGGLNGMDENYVREFIREAKQSGIPVFLRFASEMNGGWVAWHGDPELYKAKWKWMYQIVKEEKADNVVMVWSPNFLPREKIDAYYPGDEYVDWVGLSLYRFPIDAGEEKLAATPMDYLRPIYEKYKHKPMMLSELGVGIKSYSNNQTYINWSKQQMEYFYRALPREFPQIKAVNYFNYDKEGENNYSFDYYNEVKDTYKQLIQDPLFLSNIQTNDTSMKRSSSPVSDVAVKGTGERQFTVSSKLPLGLSIDQIKVFADGKEIATSKSGTITFTYDPNNVQNFTVQVIHDGVVMKESQFSTK
ncbi:glycoside hydrolase family 26 protein [Bacillus bombysepticus]|uniref:glycoside hydrolase family 26 protein n=1 Tax=Bacillus bombysepticus TaxID=658666 RepID=UPI00301A8593